MYRRQGLPFSILTPWVAVRAKQGPKCKIANPMSDVFPKY